LVWVARVLAAAVFATLFYAGFHPNYFEVFFAREELAQTFEGYPDRGLPEYRRFLEKVRTRTERGDSIALIFPAQTWSPDYEHAFMRATYLLTGRDVVPTLDRQNQMQADRVNETRYVAAWRVELPPDRFRIVWQGEGGVLAQKR
jgi:hypothetical protein